MYPPPSFPSQEYRSRPGSSLGGISVVIRDVRMSDQDTYACEVNLKDEPIKMKHKLEVLGE